MAENASKIIAKDKKVSDKPIYSFSADDISSKKAEMIIKIITIMKIIFNNILVFSLYSKIDFLFPFFSEIAILSQS
jgi:hypothetical protein